MNMKDSLVALLVESMRTLQARGDVPSDLDLTPQLERARDRQFGDFASNLAMVLAKPSRQSPRKLAEQLINALPSDPRVERVEVAGPGFINFYVRPDGHHSTIGQVLDQAAAYGHTNLGAGQHIQVEFVSANPTGPLHVGHGRGAAYGACVANVLAACGYEVTREYYVNDAGRQMDILATSVWLRYLEVCGEELSFPDNGYRGDYVIGLAKSLHQQLGKRLHKSAESVFDELPADGRDGGDKEAHIDALIKRCQQLLGETEYRLLFDHGLDGIRADIAADLEAFGVHYDLWFSERSLSEADAIEKAIEALVAKGLVYQEAGARWFASTRFGDDKDRVVQREDGRYTYFAADIAYHHNKFERGFDRIVNVWGADHHGYIPRVRAAVEALGHDPEHLQVRLVQFAILYRGSERVQMSTRSGSFITLRELREEVGNDAARFFYVLRKAEQHMDFDLELAKSQSKDNPVYYIQYAHARIASMRRKLNADAATTFDPAYALEQLHQLTEEREQQLVDEIARYPEVVEHAARTLEPHLIAHYLRDLASHFHVYYNGHRVLVEEANLRAARVALCVAVQQVLRNGLDLLGVQAPERM